MLEPTEDVFVFLRRYGHNDQCPAMPGEYGYHNAEYPLGMFKLGEIPKEPDYSDERWPKKCAGCPYEFAAVDTWQLFEQRAFRRSDNGELTTLRHAPPGAMWRATWMKLEGGLYAGSWSNMTEPPLIVRCPNGRDWDIDSRCSNCTMKEDHEHRCWCRHGEPPNVTVDKNGRTCSAGGGSIQAGDYHGFLRNGEFT